MYLIAMAGLPGTGKSTLARALARRLSAHVLDKDEVRASVFGPDRITYTREQDDHCVRLMYETVAYLGQLGRERLVVLDGRTYSKRDQVRALVDFTSTAEIPWCLIECTTTDEVAIGRLERDAALGQHKAGNRSVRLYRALQREWEPIEPERLVIDTGSGSTETHVESCLAHFRGLGWELG